LLTVEARYFSRGIEARFMLRGAKGWLLSRGATVAALGFVLSLIGALGSAFYLEPAQRTEDAASQQIVLESTRARMLRAATSYDDIAGHLGSLLFTVSLPRDASDDQRAAIGDLMRRALDHRHDGVRSYLAALAVAGAIDYPAESRGMGRLSPRSTPISTSTPIVQRTLSKATSRRAWSRRRVTPL
jgi:hypothetical protein